MFNNSEVQNKNEGLLRCCNRQTHYQMLLHEDIELLLETEPNQSKQATTDSITSSNHQIFTHTVKPTHTHKISLAQRRNTLNSHYQSKKQQRRCSLFNDPPTADSKMVDMQPITSLLQLDYKNITVADGGGVFKKQGKISLKRAQKIPTNRPHLMPFSLLENAGHIRTATTNIKPPLAKGNNYNFQSRPFQLKQNNDQDSKGHFLKLGQNLPTYRSEFHHTTESHTKRSHLS